MASDANDEPRLQVSEESGPGGDNMTRGSKLITQDWGFNALLLEISRNTTPDELDEMKFLCRGEDDGIGKKELEMIKKPWQLFDALRNRCLLDSNNLLHLQGLVWHTSRENHRKIVNFARESSKRPLHFFVPSDPVNGYTNATFHIAGTTVDKNQIDNIRNTVADILRIPRKYVLWTGATPFESILVVFMIPTRVVDILLDITPEERGYLAKLDIDKFTVNNKEVIVKGGKCDKPEMLNEKDELARLLREREEYKQQAESIQIRLFQLQEEQTAMTRDFEADNLQTLEEEQKKQLLPLQTKYDQMHERLKTMEDENKQLQPLISKVTNLQDKLQKQSMQLDKYSTTLDQSYNSAFFTIAALINMILSNNRNGREKLSRRSCLVYFRYCLSKANKEFPDKMDFIHEIIDVASVVAITSEEDSQKKNVEALQLQNSFLHSQIHQLLLLLHTQRTCDSSFPLKSTFLNRQRLNDSPHALKAMKTMTHTSQIMEMGISMSPNRIPFAPYDKALLKISELLTNQHRASLKHLFKFNQDDADITDKFPLLFMNVVFQKEYPGGSCPISEFESKVTEWLGALKDSELQKKAKELLRLAAVEHKNLCKEIFGNLPAQMPVQNLPL